MSDGTARRVLPTMGVKPRDRGPLLVAVVCNTGRVRVDRRGSIIGLLTGSSVAAQSIVGLDKAPTVRQIILVAVAIAMAFWAAKLALLPSDQKKMPVDQLPVRLAHWYM